MAAQEQFAVDALICELGGCLESRSEHFRHCALRMAEVAPTPRHTLSGACSPTQSAKIIPGPKGPGCGFRPGIPGSRFERSGTAGPCLFAPLLGSFRYIIGGGKFVLYKWPSIVPRSRAD